jgi:plasmid maintenance system antidote protein VapI
MHINDLLKQRNMTKYRLAKNSGIPQTTVIDICSGKAKIEKCSAETLYRLAKTLDTTMEDLITRSMEHRPSFETYKSHVCHSVKDMGDIAFIIHTLETDEIRKLFRKQWHLECLYLLAMLDYLSRENSLPLCANYNDIRRARLQETVFPSGVMLRSILSGNEHPKQESLAAAIPEFMRFNIVESEVRNVQ